MLVLTACTRADIAVDGQSGQRFRDCDDCPEMVVVPPGEFQMGANGGEADRPEGPVRKVRIPRAFAVSRFEVTQEQFARFVVDTGRAMPGGCQIWNGTAWIGPPASDWTNPGYGRVPFAEEPVACMTWRDADDYAAWLANRTGKSYRLLSEAEWEYAARGGAVGDYSWNSSAGSPCEHANVYDATGARHNGFDWPAFDCDDGYAQAAPVGSFAPNAFGLYDMLGNVWEWTADCYVAPYPSTPIDGSAIAVAGDCERRTVRGGSWITRPSRQRLTFRGRDPPDTRYSYFGLRVARSL